MAKELKREIILNYNWWEAGDLDIDKQDHGNLHRIAIKHCQDNMNKGFDNGPLPTQNFPSRDLMYTGYWELKIK